MKNIIVWLLVNCLMVIALLSVSCGPAEEKDEKVTPPPTQEKEEEAAPTEEEQEPSEEADMVMVRLTKSDGTVVEKLVEQPRYGGIFIQGCSSGPLNFDETYKYIHTSP